MFSPSDKKRARFSKHNTSPIPIKGQNRGEGETFMELGQAFEENIKQRI